MIDPLPIYTPGFESYQDPLNKQYPLQLTGFHYKSRVHSTYGNVDVLKAACRQEMWINPLDAQNAVSTTAIKSGSLTIVVKFILRRK